MLKYNFLPLLAGFLLIPFICGCAYFEKGVPQEVTIVSYPTECSIYINGEAIGVTPIVIELPRKIAHEVRLSKFGYNQAVKYFTPVPNDKNKNFIRFGLPEDLGYYVDLNPRSLNADMKSELVPASLGSDPFEKMAIQALEADRRLQNGEISSDEHKYIIEQIISFFEENV
ncbi:MAG: Uncharacterised protein [Opitutia bacterium UBA7350]|nr:MAG: Uncharacterised protein [Opitutae bacterium UBA7350]